ncbi:MAG: hypothetical protein GC129_02010 [Proteobacteria bacterium]|nr:hypothetical protein [Pseudomonadota bacterium]
MSYFGDEVSLQEVEDDPFRRAIIRAYKSPDAARQLLNDIVARYWEYKLHNFDFPIESLEPNAIQAPKKGAKRSLEKFLPDLHLDFLVQCLSDYLSGEKADTAFGINPPLGRKKLPQDVPGGDELAIAKFMHTRLGDGYESAVSSTIDEFGLRQDKTNEKRVKFCHEKYRRMAGWASVVKYNLQVCEIEGQFYPVMPE